MEREIGRVDMVRWQERRLAPVERARGRVIRLALSLAALSALSLTVGFYSGLPIPVEVLQTVFVLLALLALAVGVRALVLTATHRDHRSGLRPYRR